MSFEVKSLFTSIPSQNTKEVTLEKMYDWKKINTQISKTIMKELLLICTKEIHFIHEDGIYEENNAMAMVSLLAPALSGIFMVELEPAVVTTLG